MDTIKQIATELVTIRKKLGLKQREVAKKANINVSTFSNIEKARVKIGVHTCARIYQVSSILNIDYDEFMKRHGISDNMARLGKSFECRTRTRLCKKLIDDPETALGDGVKNECVYIITRNVDTLRYYAGSRIESIGDTIYKHRVYRFTTNKNEAIKFNSYEKAEKIAERLHDTKIRKEF